MHISVVGVQTSAGSWMREAKSSPHIWLISAGGFVGGLEAPGGEIFVGS